jgi:hypothetical protein
MSHAAYLPNTRLRASIHPGHYPSICTIQDRTVTQDTFGQVVETYADAADVTLRNMRCRLAPLILVRPSGTERPDDIGTSKLQEYTLILDGFKPQITTDQAAEVDGAVYNITAVEEDGSHIYTRLRLERRG